MSEATAPNVPPGRTEIVWLEETRQLMLNRPMRIKLKDIADGCNCSISWLSRLQTGTVTDAPISMVHRLNLWLRENAVPNA